MIQKVGRYHFTESSDLSFESQIMTSIGEIKALIAQWKIRDAVFPNCEG